MVQKKIYVKNQFLNYMDYQNILILNLKYLYQILKEIESDLNFKVYDIPDNKIKKKKLVEFNNPIVFTNKKIDALLYEKTINDTIKS